MDISSLNGFWKVTYFYDNMSINHAPLIESYIIVLNGRVSGVDIGGGVFTGTFIENHDTIDFVLYWQGEHADPGVGVPLGDTLTRDSTEMGGSIAKSELVNALQQRNEGIMRPIRGKAHFNESEVSFFLDMEGRIGNGSKNL